MVTQTVKNLPAMCETRVQSLDWEDPLEKGTVTHSSIIAWEIPWTEEPSWLQSMGSQRIGHDWATQHSINEICFIFFGFPGGSAGKESTCNAGDLGSIPGLGRFPGEGNGNPLHYSCLKNPLECINHGITESDMTEQISLLLTEIVCMLWLKFIID